MKLADEKTQVSYKFLWPVWRACIVYALIGYAVYFTADYASMPPAWAVDLIEALKPWMGALKTAERVSAQAFPVQMLTIYTFFASMVLTAYAAFCLLLVTEIHNNFVKIYMAYGHTRFKLFLAGVLFLGVMAMYYSLFTIDDSKPDWRAARHFSPSFASATFSLALTLAALMGAMGLFGIKLSLFGLRLKPETQ